MGVLIPSNWLAQVGQADASPMDGLVYVGNYSSKGRPPEEIALMEKAREYGVTAVFFEAEQNGRPSKAQAFIYVDDDSDDNGDFVRLHQRLWSWGQVPLVYRKRLGKIELFRCAHKPDFIQKSGEYQYNPVKTLKLAADIAGDPWWDANQLRNGTFWDSTETCKEFLSSNQSAHKALISAVADLNDVLNKEAILPKALRRRLLILSLLIAYLEQRDAFIDGFFGQFLPGATEFFQVLADGTALVALLGELEERFNGHVFVLKEADRVTLQNSQQLQRFADLIEGRQLPSGQYTLWKLYSFADLPVELISHIYQLFVKDADSSVYTPPVLVRLMLEESLSWERLDRLIKNDEVILDPACGSGVFLVEAYKRLILHWRSRHDWKKPDVKVLKRLLQHVRGIDLEGGAIELAAFSLCLTLCDALTPTEIRASVKLFPQLDGETLLNLCFFDAIKQDRIPARIGALVGNPPFDSNLTTSGAQRSYDAYFKEVGRVLPDYQLAYLFMHEGAKLLSPGGILCLLQQYNFLYNQNSLNFRRDIFRNYDVREILDFISIRGLFHKGSADTKVIVVIAEASAPQKNRQILHATFRRSGKADAEQGFDIDYYDMHWVPRSVALCEDGIWRANLLGGGRAYLFATRLREFRKLQEFAKSQEWNYGEGYIESKRKNEKERKHIVGYQTLKSEALTDSGIDTTKIELVGESYFESPRSAARFTPPMLLIRENMELQHDLWTNHYLTYTQQIVGFCGPTKDEHLLRTLNVWIRENHKTLRAYLALISPRLFVQKATALQADDIYSIPLPESGDLDLSENEKIIVDDIVDYYAEMVRTGQKSPAMSALGHSSLPNFVALMEKQIGSVYKNRPLRALTTQCWPGVICQPFVFGEGNVDWSDSDQLMGRLDRLLREKQGTSLNVTRIARIYDGNFVFLLKPDRLRYWLKSVALRDSDELLSDLRKQGF